MEQAVKGEVIKGLGVSRGVYRGKVRVLKEWVEIDARLQEGEVMVCEFTDPDWVMGFPKAGAVIAAVGSKLCHAAVISREYKIPCVVSIPGVRDRLQTGQEVEVDGLAGTIKILSDAPVSDGHVQIGPADEEDIGNPIPEDEEDYSEPNED